MNDPAHLDTQGADLYDCPGFELDGPFPIGAMLALSFIGAVFWAAVGFAIASWAGWLV